VTATAQVPNGRGGTLQFDLGLTELQQPLMNLSIGDRQIVDQVIALIKQGKHVPALAYLTSLTHSNPMNSAVRVLRAYVLLELGNLAGALDDAVKGESAGGHAGYRCWFLAQVAYIAGNKALCLREIKHISADPVYGADAEQLRQSVKAKGK
jgi:hypothetical protein